MDKRFLEMVRNIGQIDINSAPAVQFAKVLEAKLCSYGFAAQATVKDIICCLDIELSEFDANDPDWLEVIDIYSGLIYKLYAHYCVSQNHDRIYWVFSKVSIKY